MRNENIGARSYKEEINWKPVWGLFAMLARRYLSICWNKRWFFFGWGILMFRMWMMRMTKVKAGHLWFSSLLQSYPASPPPGPGAGDPEDISPKIKRFRLPQDTSRYPPIISTLPLQQSDCTYWSSLKWKVAQMGRGALTRWTLDIRIFFPALVVHFKYKLLFKMPSVPLIQQKFN